MIRSFLADPYFRIYALLVVGVAALLLLALGAGAGSAFGLYTCSVIAPGNSDVWLRLAAAAAAAAALVWVLYEFAILAPAVLTYLRPSGRRRHVSGRRPWIPRGTILRACFALATVGFLATVAVTEYSGTKPSSGGEIAVNQGGLAFVTPTVLSNQPLLIQRLDGGATHAPADSAVQALVFFFDEALRCRLLPEGGIDCAQGLDIHGASSDFFEKMIGGLFHCVEEGQGVRLVVSGFASSSEFRGGNLLRNGTPIASEEGNIMVAHQRAEMVSGELRRIRDDVLRGDGTLPVGSDDFAIVMRKWDSYEQMKAEAAFHDRRGEDFDVHRGVLTRRVEITFDEVGACAIAG